MKTLQVNSLVKLNNLFGTVLKIEGNYCLIKLDFCGTYCFNKNKILPSEILS